MIKCPDDPVSGRQCRQVEWTPMLQTLLISPQHFAWQPPAHRPQAGPEWARVQGQLVFRALIEINPDTLYTVYTLATLFTLTPACLECLISAKSGSITKQ